MSDEKRMEQLADALCFEDIVPMDEAYKFINACINSGKNPRRELRLFIITTTVTYEHRIADKEQS